MVHSNVGPTAELQHFGGKAGAVALVCIPYAGGSAAMFRSWVKSIPELDIHALALPGRGARLEAAPFTSIEPLVASACEAIVAACTLPFALFGHSMGALIAFEAARLLRRSFDLQPVHLYVSGFRAPHLIDPRPALYDLPRNEFVEEIRRIGAPTFDPDKYPELIELMLPTLRADFRVVQTYKYGEAPALNCPITAFGGRADPEVAEWQLSEWRQHTNGPFSISLHGGNHACIVTDPREIQRRIGRDLAGVRPETIVWTRPSLS
jgi:medium-chain acyl-[acyl-carrier-protein] hydrolase